MAGTVPIWLLIATLAVYGGFLVGYGETVFDLGSIGDCDGIGSCGSAIFNFIGQVFQFITLGGFESPLPALLQPILLLFFGIAWGFYIYSAITDAVGAVVP